MDEEVYRSWAAAELHYDCIVLDETVFPSDPGVC